MKSYTFSNEDFTAFSEAVQYWVCRFGLSEWNVVVEHEQIGDNVQANASYEPKSKQALVRLTKSAEGDYGFQPDMKALALHEVLHLLFSDFCWVAAKAKDDYADVVQSHEHAIINRLVRVIKE
jgi:hypothetical protein